MSVITPGLTTEMMCEALLRYSASFAGALRDVRDPAKPAIGVWNIAETAVHVSQSSPNFLAAARGQAEPENLGDNARANQQGVAAEPERRLTVLADRIVARERELAGYAREMHDDPLVTPFQGLTMPLSLMLGIELGELLVHGFDVTRAAGLPWEIRPADAAMALSGVLQALPLLLDASKAASVRLSCDLRIRHGQPWLIQVRDGSLKLSPVPAATADCHVSVDPVPFLLLSFDRISPVWPLLTGKILLWGRKPWAFATLQSLLRQV